MLASLRLPGFVEAAKVSDDSLPRLGIGQSGKLHFGVSHN
jgi:hypothetical protein